MQSASVRASHSLSRKTTVACSVQLSMLLKRSCQRLEAFRPMHHLLQAEGMTFTQAGGSQC